ncbi:MAG: alpha/beta fold hydrolase [Rhodocyclaceae bacterium]|nr:alpha/beta fold hydrolase [Rhodocyclaceae bacterium]
MSTPLVLLHGWGSAPGVWDPLVAALPTPRQTLAPALPGHADAAPMTASLEGWAASIAAGLPAQFDLCGWSLGALVALTLAATAPARVRRLVVLGASPSFARRPDWPHGLPMADIEAFLDEFERDAAGLMKRFTGLQTLGDSARRAVATRLRIHQPTRDDADGGLAAGLRLLRDADVRPLLAQIDCPVRILHGRGDALMPVSGAPALADLLADARLTVLEDCGHAPHLSRAADCATLIAGFLGD